MMMNTAVNVKYAPNELIATEVLSTKNALGESPIWSVRDQALYWISSPEGEVWRWDLINLPHRRLMNTVIGCIGLLGQSNSIIVAGENGMWYINMDHPNEPNLIVHRPEYDTTTRPNDGRVDRDGNLVLGMYNNYHRGGGPTVGKNNASLFRLSSNTLQWDDILCNNNNQEYRYRVSNCICFSPDGSVLYFSDTPTRTLYAFDYTPDGPLTNRRHVWTMPASMPGALDGAQIDNRGKLWIAVTGGNMVIQLNPINGKVETIVRINANPTSVTFGGTELDELFITTRAPDGGIFRVKIPGVRGVAEPEFK
jgi:L-arabinonolactonase